MRSPKTSRTRPVSVNSANVTVSISETIWRRHQGRGCRTSYTTFSAVMIDWTPREAPHRAPAAPTERRPWPAPRTTWSRIPASTVMAPAGSTRAA
jgi:hypothetical protein